MNPDVETIEINLLLEGIFQRYGYDFRQYSRASMERRVRAAMVKMHLPTISELTGRILHDPVFFQEVVADFSITVTEMFRDPEMYRVLREKVMPYLATYPFLKVWHAGCSTGEEVYSLAIVLWEEGLLERTTIYATDFNEAALQRVRDGIYPVDRMKEYCDNYRKAGGRRSFSDYYHAQYDFAIMAPCIKRNITIARHNLVTDHVFGEMHLVLCRNVLIYFDKTLQDRVLRLFDESLVHGGFLCLGTKESLGFSAIAGNFQELDAKQKIYHKLSLP